MNARPAFGKPPARQQHNIQRKAQKRAKLQHAKCLRKTGTQETLSDSPANPGNRKDFVSFFFSRELCILLVNEISVTLCPS